MECIYCGCDSYKVLYELPDYLLGSSRNIATLVKCVNCGLIYQNPLPSIDKIVSFYPQHYDLYHPPINKENTSWLVYLMCYYGVRKRIRTVTKFKTKGKLLDVGCSTGTFLLEMTSLPDWKVMGVDISHYATQIAREYGLEVETGTLEQISYPDQFFDVITLWDVFEHIHDPKKTLQEISRILKPGGLLVLRIPNLDSWDAKIFSRYWVGLDPPRHLHFFSAQKVQCILIKAGFRVLNIQTNSGNYPSTVLSIRSWMTANFPKQIRDRVIKILNHPLTRFAIAPLFILTTFGLSGALLTVTAQLEGE